jgi:hypothetical protein
MHLVGVPALGPPLGHASAEGSPYRRIVIEIDDPPAAVAWRSRLASP